MVFCCIFSFLSHFWPKFLVLRFLEMKDKRYYRYILVYLQCILGYFNTIVYFSEYFRNNVDLLQFQFWQVLLTFWHKLFFTWNHVVVRFVTFLMSAKVIRFFVKYGHFLCLKKKIKHIQWSLVFQPGVKHALVSSMTVFLSVSTGVDSKTSILLLTKQTFS